MPLASGDPALLGLTLAGDAAPLGDDVSIQPARGTRSPAISALLENPTFFLVLEGRGRSDGEPPSAEVMTPLEGGVYFDNNNSAESPNGSGNSSTGVLILIKSMGLV